jgi:hypothetical protein
MKAKAKVFQKKLKKLLDLVEQKRPGFQEAIGHGCSIDEIYAEFSQNNIPFSPEKIPDELIAIYSCLGNPYYLRPEEGTFMWLDIIPLFEFIPFCKIKQEIDIVNEMMHACQAMDLDWIQPDMIPFLKDRSSDYVCFRTLEKNRSVYSIDHVEGAYYYCLDLGAYFDMLYEMYENNVFFTDNDGYLDCDWDLEEEISKKYSLAS